MRLHKTGHPIADTVSDLIGELPDEWQISDTQDLNRGQRCEIVYGILRHDKFNISGRWFEIDKGFWGANHYDGNYRISYRGTQPIYSSAAPHEGHGLILEPWRDEGEWTMICPPTDHVCEFFGIDISSWWFGAIETAKNFKEPYMARDKSATIPIDWSEVRRVITFNSTVGIEALRRGIPVISDPEHSSIGSYTKIMGIDNYDREPLFSWLSAHQFRLSNKEKICKLIKHYLTKP